MYYIDVINLETGQLGGTPYEAWRDYPWPGFVRFDSITKAELADRIRALYFENEQLKRQIAGMELT